MKLTNYVNAIFAIAEHNHVDWDTGVHMFLNNVHDAGDPTDLYHYYGAEYVNYASLKTELDAMTDEEIRDMTNKTIDYIGKNREVLYAQYKEAKN